MASVRRQTGFDAGRGMSQKARRREALAVIDSSLRIPFLLPPPIPPSMTDQHFQSHCRAWDHFVLELSSPETLLTSKRASLVLPNSSALSNPQAAPPSIGLATWKDLPPPSGSASTLSTACLGHDPTQTLSTFSHLRPSFPCDDVLHVLIL